MTVRSFREAPADRRGGAPRLGAPRLGVPRPDVPTLGLSGADADPVLPFALPSESPSDGGADPAALLGLLLGDGGTRLPEGRTPHGDAGTVFGAGGAGPWEGRTGAARSLIARFGSLRRLAAARAREIETAAGLDRETAARIESAFELGRLAHAERFRRDAPFTSSRDIFERFHPLLRDLKKERFLAVLVDGKNRVMREDRVSEGSLTSSLVHPREVFGPALREGAANILFVHNHPSGDPEPSPEDHSITERLCAVGELLGIKVLDHLVVGDGTYVSFLDRGWV